MSQSGEPFASLPPRSVDGRLDELSSKLRAILSSAATNSTPPNAMPGESET